MGGGDAGVSPCPIRTCSAHSSRVPGSETILFQSKLEPSMAGKMVSVAGQVVSVAQRQTRNDRPFLIATLGMMDGPIEVAVWENVLKETPGLWEEGRLVLVKGTVRERDEAAEHQLQGGCRIPDRRERRGGVGLPRWRCEVQWRGADSRRCRQVCQ